tara:strand:- start:7352 stop:8503 length:1152 start_codon:yes stop_codon:yes gene_type:complete
MKKKLLLNLTEDWFFCSHFLERALAAKKAGYSIFVLSRQSLNKDVLDNYGVKFISVPFDRKSTNPFYEFYVLIKIILIYKKVRPDIVHHVALKPVIYGSIAARICRIKSVINAPVGMGYVFTSDNIKAKILRPLLKILFKFLINSHNGINKRNKVIFENNDDLNYFINLKAVNPKNACIIQGAGVKIKQTFQPQKNKKIPTIALVARMLKDKGINEFVEASKIVNREKILGNFLLVGDIDPGNPSSLKRQTLAKWNDDKIIKWLGWIDNVGEILKKTDILCLPSYREGLPKALIEGAAYGLPIVTTNTVGCKDVVEDGVNGFLVPIKNVDQLSKRILELIKSKDLRNKMGKASFNIASRKFSSEIINSQTLDVYNEMFFEFKE